MKRASTGHESYEHVLMCLICRSLFDEHDHQPKFLPCHHTFCKDCLRQYVAQLGDEIECPSCRRLATIPAAGVAALQTNFYAKYIQTLVYGCVGSGSDWVSDCERHPGRRLLHFCRDCGVSICDACLQERGCARHRCDLLTVVVERFRCDMDAAFSETNALIESRKTELERLLKLIAGDKDDALIRIESTFEQHVHALTRRATLLKNKVIDIYNEHAARLDADLEEVATGLTCIVSLKEHYEPMISRGDFTDAEKGIEELRDVRRNLSERIRPRVNRILFEERHGADGFRNGVKDLGRVVSKPGEFQPVKSSKVLVEDQSPGGDGECIISSPELDVALDSDKLGPVAEKCEKMQPLLSSISCPNPAPPDASSPSFKTEVSVNIRNSLLCATDLEKRSSLPNRDPVVCQKDTASKQLQSTAVAMDCSFNVSVPQESSETVLKTATFSGPSVASRGEEINRRESSTEQLIARCDVIDSRFDSPVVPKSSEKSLKNQTVSVASQGVESESQKLASKCKQLARSDVTGSKSEVSVASKSNETALTIVTYPGMSVTSRGEENSQKDTSMKQLARTDITDCKFDTSVASKSSKAVSINTTFSGQPLASRGEESNRRETSAKQLLVRSDETGFKSGDSSAPKSNERQLAATFSTPVVSGEGNSHATCSLPTVVAPPDSSKLHTSTVVGRITGDGRESDPDSLPQVTLTLNLDNLRAVSIRSENCSLAEATSSANVVPILSRASSSSGAESDETVSAESELKASASSSTRRCTAHKSYDEPRLRLELGYDTSDAEDASASPSRQMSRSDFWLMMSSSVESNLSEHDLIVAELSGEQTSL